MAQQQERVVVELSDFNLYKNFIQNNSVVILKAGAIWCGPCKRIEPYFFTKIQELPRRVCVILLDIDKSPSITRRLSIKSVPCLISIIRGEPMDVITGANIDSINKFFEKIKKRLQ